MSYNTPSMDDIINDLGKRIAALERAAYVFGDTNNTNNDPLTITGLTPTITYYSQPITGIPLARVVWTWSAPPAPDPDDLTADPVVDYMFSSTSATSPQIEAYASTNGATTVTDTALPLGTVQTARVYAVTKKGINGPIASATANIVSDTTAPPQPSTPAVAAALKGVTVTWDGLDSTSLAMPVDFAYVEVHASTTGGVTFTPTNATLVDRIYSGRGGTFITANANYDPINVRLIAVDTSKNASTPSTGAVATPVRAVATDLGVVLPGDIAFSDVDNLVPDGSFENAAMRTLRDSLSTSGVWSWDNTAGVAAQGSWTLKATNTTGTNAHYLTFENAGQVSAATAPPGTKVYLACRMKGVSANGTVVFGIRFMSQTGVTTFATVTTTSSTGSWVVVEGVATVPSDCASISAYVQTISQTTGTWYFDTVTLRRVTPTMLIEDAAITTAKIASLAVGDAQIANLDGGKINALSIDAQKLRLGVVTRNMVSDPSFEEDTYAGISPATPDYTTWSVTSGTGTFTRVTNGRSGVKSMKIAVAAGAGVFMSSNAMPVTAGQTYVLSIYMTGLAASSTTYIRVGCGTTQACNEYPYGTAPTGSAGAALKPADKPNVSPAESSCTRIAADNSTTAMTSFEAIVPPVASNTTVPAFTDYYLYTATYVIPAGMSFATIYIRPGTVGAVTIQVDDVSFLPLGQGAAELTSGGLRLFDQNGLEAGAFVSNRQTAFSISRDGNTVASISNTGDTVVKSLSIIGTDTDSDGVADSGFNLYGQTFADYMSVYPKGIIVMGFLTSAAPGGAINLDTNAMSLEAAQLEMGRLYRYYAEGYVDNDTAGSRTLVKLYHSLNGGALTALTSYRTPPVQSAGATWPFRLEHLFANGSIGGGTYDATVYITIAADDAVSRAHQAISSADPWELSIEDVGIYHGNYGNNELLATVPPRPKQFTSVWEATNSATYDGSATPALMSTSPRIQQGVFWGYGNTFATMVFTGNAVSGETTKSLATVMATSGMVINRVEVYLDNNAWIRSAGGNAVIRANTQTAIANTVPSGTAITVTNWPQGAAQWVDITSIWTTSMRGVWIGRGLDNATSYSGTFADHTVTTSKPKLRISYRYN